MSPGRRLAHTAAPGTSAPAATPAGCRVSERVAQAGSRGGALRGGGRWPSQAGALGRPVFSSAGRCVRTSQRQEDSASFLERVEPCEVASSLRRGPPCRGCARSPGEGRRPVAPRRRGSRREAAWLLGRKAVPPPEAGARPRPCAGGHGGAESGGGLRRACDSRGALSGRPAP